MATGHPFDTAERCRVRGRFFAMDWWPSENVGRQPAVRKPRWTKPKPPVFRRKPPPKWSGPPIGRFKRHRVPFA
jgi:hypothetical protein